MGKVVTKGLEISSDPVRSSHKGRSRKVLKFPGPLKCIQPYHVPLLNTCRLGVEAKVCQLSRSSWRFS